MQHTPAPALLYVPAAQLSQDDSPAALNVPAAQRSQEAGATGKVPAGHEVAVKAQDDAPDGLYAPAAQLVQEEVVGNA